MFQLTLSHRQQVALALDAYRTVPVTTLPSLHSHVCLLYVLSVVPRDQTALSTISRNTCCTASFTSPSTVLLADPGQLRHVSFYLAEEYQRRYKHPAQDCNPEQAWQCGHSHQGVVQENCVLSSCPLHCLCHCRLTICFVLQVVRALTGFAPKHSKHASLDSAVDLSFRLYKHESGAMNRVSVDEQALERAFSQDNDMVWEAVQSPRIGAVNKYAAALRVLVFQRFPLQYQ